MGAEAPGSISEHWVARLEPRAPDVVACWRLADAGGRAFLREIRRRSGPGTASSVLAQQEAVADALRDGLLALPDEALRLPGNEGNWNVAQTFAHTTGARRFLARAAALAASGAWPVSDPPRAIAGVPGRADADRETLLTLLEKSRASVAESAALIAGHEADRCSLDHPIVGPLRCGGWLLFIGVHDLMHLEQLHGLAAHA